MTAELAAWMIGSDNVEDGAAVLRAQQARAAATAAASTAPPSECPGVIPAKDQSLLVALMGQEAVGRLLALDQSILEAKRQGRTFKTGWVDLVDQGDRTIRSNIHQVGNVMCVAIFVLVHTLTSLTGGPANFRLSHRNTDKRRLHDLRYSKCHQHRSGPR